MSDHLQRYWPKTCVFAQVEHLEKFPVTRIGRVCDFTVSGQRYQAAAGPVLFGPRQDFRLVFIDTLTQFDAHVSKCRYSWSCLVSYSPTSSGSGMIWHNDGTKRRGLLGDSDSVRRRRDKREKASRELARLDQWKNCQQGWSGLLTSEYDKDIKNIKRYEKDPPTWHFAALCKSVKLWSACHPTRAKAQSRRCSQVDPQSFSIGSWR